MKRFASAALLVAGLVAGAAQSQAQTAFGSAGGTVVGGGLGATLVGGADDMTITYGGLGAGGGGASLAQTARLARFVGTDGDGPVFDGMVPAPMAAGREARLVGGGADSEVTYGVR
jgi:hypothetical protein